MAGMHTDSITLADKASIVLQFSWLPFAILIGLVRRFVAGSDGKSLTADVLLTIARWSASLPLSLQRNAVKGLNVKKQVLNAPRFRHVKQDLCQHVEREDFSGYWIAQGSLYNETTPPPQCDLVLLWIHGGAYVLGSALADGIQVLRISEILSTHDLSMAVFSLDYGLAPETTFPVPFEQGLAAYRYLLEEVRVPAEKIVVCGDSAGGHLAVAVLDQIYRKKLPKPGYALLQYPWVDMTNSGKSVVRNKHNDMLNAQRLNMAVQLACGSNSAAFEDVLDFSAPRPQHYWSKVLPKTWVGVGSHDLFVDSVHDFVSHAQDDGCDIRLEVWPLAPHGWPTMRDILGKRRYLRLQPGEDATSLTQGAEMIAMALVRMTGR